MQSRTTGKSPREERAGPSAAALPAAAGLGQRRSVARGHNEPLNVLTHGAGAVLALAGLIALLRVAGGDRLKAASFLVYGLSMVFLYSASTALHLFRLPRPGRRVLRRIDHAAIYLFIAGTHTPLCTITLGEPHGRALLSVVWTLALAGIAFKVFYLDAARWLSTATYLATGWMAVLLVWPLSEALSGPALAWLLAGGFFYTAGSAVFLFRWPNPLPGLGHHEIWHFAVLAGSACHFYMIWHYVAPAPLPLPS